MHKSRQQCRYNHPRRPAMNIRKMKECDMSRVAEIIVFNNRINFYPIFKDEKYSFYEMQVVSLIDKYLKNADAFNNTYVYDDGIIRGFIQIKDTEICKLYVDPCMQSSGIGHQLIEFAINHMGANFLWTLEKNVRAISFYKKHGFDYSGKKQFEEGTTEYLVELTRM